MAPSAPPLNLPMQLEQYFGHYVPFCHTQVIVTDLGSPPDFDFTDYQTLQTLP